MEGLHFSLFFALIFYYYYAKRSFAETVVNPQGFPPTSTEGFL